MRFLLLAFVRVFVIIVVFLRCKFENIIFAIFVFFFSLVFVVVILTPTMLAGNNIMYSYALNT